MQQLIIFDIDGTLVHSDKADSKAFAMTYEAVFGKPFPSINWNDYTHVTDETIFETVYTNHFGRKATTGEKENFRNQYIAQLERLRMEQPDDFKAVWGAVEVIRHLQNLDNYHVGIATGGWAAPAKIKLNHVGLDYNTMYCGYADDNYTREEIIQEAISHAEKDIGKVDRIVYIGDASWDVTTTRNLDMPFIGVRRLGDVQLLQQLGARDVIVDYLDLKGFMHLLEHAIPPIK
jgi:phosphoglycolate phosphatase-like HAD superfamily hydrolase